MMGIENSQRGQAPPPTSLKIMFFKYHGETWVQITSKQYMEKFQHFRKEFLTIRKLQEQFENVAHEHQKAAYEKVQTAATLATSRAAPQMTARFRCIDNDVEGELQSATERIIVRKSHEALEAERHSPRRGTLPIKEVNLKDYHHHAQSQSEKLRQSQAELRQNLERSNTEGMQLTNPCEET